MSLQGSINETASRNPWWSTDLGKAALVIAPFVVFWCLHAIFSVELYSDDDMGHYMIARYAPDHPKLFLDIWGRPLFTFLYCPGSQLGMVGARMTSVLLGLLVCWLVFVYARERGYARPWLVVLVLALMGRFYSICYTLDTAMAACVAIAAAMALYAKDKKAWAAVAISFAPAGRLEAVIVVASFVLLLAYRRQWKYIPLAFTGLFVWNLAGFAVSGDPLWLLHGNPYQVSYGWQGEVLHYFKKFPELTSAVHLPFFLAGLVLFLRSRDAEKAGMAALWLVFFSFMVISWWRGAAFTVGLTRYFNTVAPVMAVVTLAGINSVLDDERTRAEIPAYILAFAITAFLIAVRGSYYIATAAAFSLWAAAMLAGRFGSRRIAGWTLAAGFLAFSLWTYLPFKLPELKPEHVATKTAADWYNNNAPKDRLVLCSDYWFDFFTVKDPYDEKQVKLVTMSNINSAPPGTLIFWDWHYAAGERYGNIPLDFFGQTPGYVLLWLDYDLGWAVFEKRI